MSIKNEFTKSEPASPWLSYVNVDDNDVFGYEIDADLGVVSFVRHTDYIGEKLTVFYTRNRTTVGGPITLGSTSPRSRIHCLRRRP